ncbi:MAG: cobalamin-binding protein [Solirubrobacterales bacterium]
MRIASLVPSSTEMLFELGLGDDVVAVTHECDWPPEAAALPHLTCTVVPEGLSAAEIDRTVRETVAAGRPLYELDRDRLEQQAPDLIVTQAVCEVCAVSYDDVVAVAATLPGHPKVVSLDPMSLGEVLADIERLGDAAGVPDRGQGLRVEADRRIDAVRNAVAGAPRPQVAALEWLDPPFIGGHWVPEMIDLAGGNDVLGRAGERSRTVSWEEISAARPDVAIAMPCGYDAPRSAEEARTYGERLGSLGAGRVVAVDASAYFSRPGPRLVTGIELLAHILHPDQAEAPPANGAAGPLFVDMQVRAEGLEPPRAKPTSS